MIKNSKENKTILNNVEMIQDGDVIHFVPVEDENKYEEINSKGFWRKVWEFFTGPDISPYVKIRNLSDPFGDKDYEGGTKSAIEAGVKIKF